MIRSAIIILCVNYGAFLFSQELRFSRDFLAMKKNLPVAILNNHDHYFHVLRNNRDVHDLTLERRAKPSGELIVFTPLKLDSINATWFNYENLDYVFHEYKHVVYFLFEKVTNTRKEFYVKSIDSLGKASGFKLLAALDLEKGITNMIFEYKIIEESKLLLISTSDHVNGTTKKVAQLFDLQKKEQDWIKKLPIENAFTGYSTGFACNLQGDLFYVMIQAEFQGFKRKYIEHRQTDVPFYLFRSLDMVNFAAGNTQFYKKAIPIKDLNSLNCISIYPEQNKVSLFIHYTKGEEPKSEKVFFLTQEWNSDLSAEVYSHITPLAEPLEKQLTFFDGTDYNTAADKEFDPMSSVKQEKGDFILLERKEKNNYKEMLLLNIDRNQGLITRQDLIPRKINYFDDRSRIKHLGLTTQVDTRKNYYVLFFESKSNETELATKYNYSDFNKLRSAKGANVVMYVSGGEEGLTKKVIYKNNGFDYVPLNYQTNRHEFILYFNRTKLEKFAILKVNQP